MRNTEIFDFFPKTKLTRYLNDWQTVKLPQNCIAGLCLTEKEVIHLAGRKDLEINFFVAGSPQAIYQCKMMKLPYLNIDNFYDISIFLASDETMLEYQAYVFKEIDQFLQEKIPDFKDFDFCPAGEYFFFLKVLCDMLFRAAVGISHLMLNTDIQHLYFFPAKEQKIDNTLFPGIEVYKMCLPLFCKTYEISHSVLEPLGCEAFVLKKEKNPVRRFLSEKKKILKNFLTTPLLFNRSDYVLFKQGYDVDYLIEVLRKNRQPVFSFDDILKNCRSEQGAQEILEKLQPLKSGVYDIFHKHRFFVWAGVDLFPVAEPYIDFWYGSIVPEMWASFTEARNFFKGRRPLAVVLFSPWNVCDFGILHAAKNLGIPRITYQHGGFEGICEYTIYDMTELRQCDYRFVYGEGVSDYFRHRTEKYKEKMAELIPVGSARLDSLSVSAFDETDLRKILGINKEKKVVLYIPTSYQYNWYMSREAYLSCLYFEFLYGLCDIFLEFRGIEFIYKPFPELPEDPMIKVFSPKLKNCRIVRNLSVPRLASISDAIIVDIPSTALLEVLLSDKPVLVFSDRRFISIRDEARKLLEKRAMVSQETDDFYRKLKEFLSSDFSSIKNNDRDFLKVYGTYLDDGKSLERASNKLTEIIKKHNG